MEHGGTTRSHHLEVHEVLGSQGGGVASMVRPSKWHPIFEPCLCLSVCYCTFPSWSSAHWIFVPAGRPHLETVSWKDVM